MNKTSYYLTGFMAAGKSRLGAQLAQLLEVPFTDLDDYIEAESGLEIPVIFELYGENGFRNFERKYLLQLIEHYRGVLSLGGGALHNQSMVDSIKQRGTLVFINTPLNVILNRLYKDKKRPLLRDASGNMKSKKQIKKQLTSLYKKRLPLYKKADIHFKPQNEATIPENSQQLLEQVKQYEFETQH